MTLWTMARQAPLSMGLSRQEYWSGLLFPSPEDLPDPGIEPVSAARQVDSLPLSHQGSLQVAFSILGGEVHLSSQFAFLTSVVGCMCH